MYNFNRGSLWAEFSGHRWIPLTKAGNADLRCFLCCLLKQVVQCRCFGTPQRSCDVTVRLHVSIDQMASFKTADGSQPDVGSSRINHLMVSSHFMYISRFDFHLLWCQRKWCLFQIGIISISWWKHFPRYWPFFGGIHWSQRPVTRSFDVFFDLGLNKRLSKKARRRWFETPLRSSWRHLNVELLSSHVEQGPYYVHWTKHIFPTLITKFWAVYFQAAIHFRTRLRIHYKN